MGPTIERGGQRREQGIVGPTRAVDAEGWRPRSVEWFPRTLAGPRLRLEEGLPRNKRWPDAIGGDRKKERRKWGARSSRREKGGGQRIGAEMERKKREGAEESRGRFEVWRRNEGRERERAREGRCLDD
jgi:hypothetical protein